MGYYYDKIKNEITDMKDVVVFKSIEDAFIYIDRSIAYSIIDLTLGNKDIDLYKIRKKFSQMELSIIKDFIKKVPSTISSAFKNIANIDFVINKKMYLS